MILAVQKQANLASGTGCRPALFTLVEMLVVIGIVMLLAAMIMAGVASSRAKGAQADCLNNLRQLHLASHLYMEEHDETYAPGHGYDPTVGYNAGYYRFWIEDVAKYMEDFDMTRCPAAESGWADAYWRGLDGKLYSLLYNINFLNRVDRVAKPVRHQDVVQPEGTVEFVDGHGGCIHQVYLHTDLNPTPDDPFIKVQARHNRRMNLIFFDGHADGVRATQASWWTFEAD